MPPLDGFGDDHATGLLTELRLSVSSGEIVRGSMTSADSFGCVLAVQSRPDHARQSDDDLLALAQHGCLPIG
jgi:hypothetical protein